MSRIFYTFVFTSLCLAVTAPIQGGTIIKLGFSTDSLPDIELADGMLSTADDLIGATTGDQATEVTFLGALAGQGAIEGDNASFTLEGVQLVNTPTIFGTTILHATEGGTFSLYDPSNVLLLAGTLGDGTLSGPIGGTATGGFLTTEFGEFTDGTLLSVLEETTSLRSSFSISLTDVNGGGGFATRDNGELAEFQADATANIGAQEVPEPTTWALLCLGILAALAIVRIV